MNRILKDARFLIFHLVLVLILSSSASADAERFYIGAYSFSLPANSSWQPTGEHEVNHWTVLTHKGGQPAVIMISLEAVSAYQNTGNAENILQFSHEQWADYLVSHGRSIEHESQLMRGPDELWVEMKIVKGEEVFQTTRVYRLFKDTSLIVIGTLEAPDSNEEFKKEFHDVMKTVRIHEDFLSPCVRTGMLAKQFLRFTEIHRRAGELEHIQAYRTSLIAELKDSLKHHMRHARATYYLLGYLESMNAKGELLGVGFHFDEARDWFKKAHATNPSAVEPLEALRALENINAMTVNF